MYVCFYYIGFINLPMNNQKFSLRKRLKSFKYAFNGLGILLRDEHNSRIHLFFAILTIFGGFWFTISSTEWMILLLTIALVFAAEFFNSAIEALADKISPEKDELIKKAKDVAAGGVLITAIISVIVGVLIFGERLLLVAGF
jgi:diacylglycerol kinase (ATP)